MPIYRTKLQEKPDKEPSGKTIYNIIFHDNTDVIHSFGSIAAIFDKFSPEEVAVSKSRLWSYGITPEKPYKNKTCAIYKGEIHRKKGNRKKSNT